MSNAPHAGAGSVKVAWTRADRVAVAWLLAVAGLMVFLYGGIDYAGEYAGVDLRHYRRMAQASPELAADIPSPFRYRIAGPWLAGLLPVPDPVAFRWIATTASLTLVAGLFAYMRSVESIASAPAAVATGLFVMNPYLFGFNTFNYFQVGDLIALIALLAAFWAARTRRYGLLGLALAAGVVFRESTLLALPAVAVLIMDEGRLRTDGVKAGLAALPALALFSGVRLLLGEGGGPGLVEALLDEGRKAARPETWFRILIGAFAPLSVLPLVFHETTRSFFRERRFLVAYFAVVVLSCFFGHDQERLMQPAFLTFFPLIGVIADQRIVGRPWFLAIVLLAAVAASLHHISARYPLPSQDVRATVLLGSLAMVTVAALAVRWRARDDVPAAVP